MVNGVFSLYLSKTYFCAGWRVFLLWGRAWPWALRAVARLEGRISEKTEKAMTN
jgi:hypothetical protein